MHAFSPPSSLSYFLIQLTHHPPPNGVTKSTPPLLPALLGNGLITITLTSRSGDAGGENSSSRYDVGEKRGTMSLGAEVRGEGGGE